MSVEHEVLRIWSPTQIVIIHPSIQAFFSSSSSFNLLLYSYHPHPPLMSLMTTPTPLFKPRTAPWSLSQLSLSLFVSLFLSISLCLSISCSLCTIISLSLSQSLSMFLFRPRGCCRLCHKESVLSQTQLDEKGTEDSLDKIEGPYQCLLETRGVKG